MPIKILMPALSPTMTEGNLARWNKSEGDKVKAGEVIAEIETDKATMEVEAVDEGIIKKIIIQAGASDVPVNSVIAVLAEEGEDEKLVQEFIDNITKAGAINSKISKESSSQGEDTDSSQSLEASLEAADKVSSSKSGAGFASYGSQTSTKSGSGGRVFASPLAKRIASQETINLHEVIGSGPHGRIVKTDVLDFLASIKSGKSRGRIFRNSEEFRLEPNSNMRRVIAKRLLESKNTIPHFYLNIDCKIDALLNARQQINDSLEATAKASQASAKNLTGSSSATDKIHKISVNDFIIMASSRALGDVPGANSSWGDQAIKLYNNVDVAVAVAIDGGLVTPVVKNADQKDLITISKEMKDLASRARAGKLMPEEYQGGGFSISNLGMYGIKNFNAIINPPQSCILAVGSSIKKPIVSEDNSIQIATIMEVCLSCDHRVVDGAVGANFLASFKKYIENPILMFL